jgi:hypothetical protein
MAQSKAGNALTPDERERMHGGRKRFDTEKDAIDYVVGRRRRGMSSGSGRVYQCLVCAKWHAGTGFPVLTEPRAANG